MLDWPANSPDLNPIENLCIVKRKMRDTRPNITDDLKAAIKATWASITSEQCHRLIASVPRRIDAVIHAKGGPTKYWVHRNETLNLGFSLSVRNKGLTYFTLCVMNLYNIWVSLSEISEKKYWPFSWYSNFFFVCVCLCIYIYIYIYIYICVCVCIYVFILYNTTVLVCNF